MRRRGKPRNTGGMLMLALVVLVDGAFVFWAWQRYADRREETATPEAPDRPMVAAAGEPEEPYYAATAADAPEEPMGVAPSAYAPPQPRRPAPYRPPAAATAGAAATSAAPAPRSAPADPRGREHLPAAEAHYRRLRGQPRYRVLVEAWTDEFVKHRDLRAANHRYWQDHDAFAFMLGVLRSPNFLRVVARFASRPDLQAFVRDMASSPAVGASARLVADDPRAREALAGIRVPGLPPLGTLAGGGRPDPNELLRSVLRSNPGLAGHD